MDSSAGCGASGNFSHQPPTAPNPFKMREIGKKTINGAPPLDRKDFLKSFSAMKNPRE
jgi:hypothetical protein